MIPYQPPRAPEQIPLIDLAGSRAGDPERRSKAVEQIRDAAMHIGFFYVTGHGVPESLMHSELEWAGRFFDLPAEAKRALDTRKQANGRGYSGAESQILDDGSAPDLKESLVLGRELPPDHWLIQKGAPFEGANPAINLPGFANQVHDYGAALAKLGEHLGGLLALSLELPAAYFQEGLQEPSVSMRMLRYPPTSGPGRENQLGAGAHTDWGFLTILLQDDCGGLQVRLEDDDWIAAPPIDGTFVVNLGDMVSTLTGGRYRSSVHRVLNNLSGRNRHSVATFYNPHHFYRFERAPTCREAGLAEEPITFGEHIEAMVRKTYAGEKA